MDNLEKLAA